MKDAALRISLPSELHREFLSICKAQDKPATQALWEYMWPYAQRKRDLLDDKTSADRI
jgi:hypothetical protein